MDGESTRGRRRYRPDEQIEDILLRAAWMYYYENKNQSDIAQEFGVSRATVVNYLQQARERGLVEIRLDPVAFNRQRLSVELCRNYGLQEAVVIPGSELDLGGVALGAAKRFPDLLDEGDVVGVAWGMTIFSMSEKITPRRIDNVTIVQMVGSMESPYVFAAESCSTNIARRLGARVANFYAPAILSSVEAARILRQEPVIQSQFAELDRINKAVFAVGSCEASSHVVESGIASLDDLQDYIARGAVGVVCGRFIDGRGNHVVGRLDERMIGITPDALRGLTVGMLVSNGFDKVAGMRAAMLGGYVTHLVTDAPTAQAILNEDL
ncbi:MAG: DeoR family transcriptional regulator [Rhizobiaceae bacterium MnEN-MB40S]|nr:MAG: DeoR family transcriptional regulator [Rhizobiaceae bacterium MnEN-MB40S]